MWVLVLFVRFYSVSRSIRTRLTRNNNILALPPPCTVGGCLPSLCLFAWLSVIVSHYCKITQKVTDELWLISGGVRCMNRTSWLRFDGYPDRDADTGISKEIFYHCEIRDSVRIFAYNSINKLCGRPPQYAPPPWKLIFDLLTVKMVSESRVTWATLCQF